MKRNQQILIVDDNMNFVDRVIGLLEDLDNISHINVASNYDEARKLFFSEDHRIVLLDINLPGKNGIELLKIFKESKKDTDIIMVTNHADAYYQQQCMELGAKHFLDKSNDFSLLPGIINNEFSN
jgi:DNA-binding NtrC family response regulator